MMKPLIKPLVRDEKAWISSSQWLLAQLNGPLQLDFWVAKAILEGHPCFLRGVKESFGCEDLDELRSIVLYANGIRVYSWYEKVAEVIEDGEYEDFFDELRVMTGDKNFTRAICEHVRLLIIDKQSEGEIE